MVGLFLTDS